MSEVVGKGNLRDKSNDALLVEWLYWCSKIKDADSWGVSLAAADGFHKSCENEMQRRGIEI